MTRLEKREWEGKDYIVLVHGGYSLGAIQLDYITEPETIYWHFVASERYGTDNPLQTTGSAHETRVPPGLSEVDQLIWKLEQFEIAECRLEYIYEACFKEPVEQLMRRRIAEEVLPKL